MIHKGYCLATLGKLTKECPGGSYIGLKSAPRDPGGRPLMAIGYKYNSWEFLRFIDIEGDESSEAGNTYLSLLPDNYSNIFIHPFVCPSVLRRNFNTYDSIYN